MLVQDDRWALITGVSEGGLGDALATAFLNNGINVIVTAPDLKALDYLPIHNASADRVTLQLDVTSPDSIAAAVDSTQRLLQHHGTRLSFLVNNAGYGYMMPLLDAPLEAIKHNFDVNVFGLLAVTQAFFPLLRAAKGIVVNQASIAGLPGICQPFIGSYSASKTAVADFSNTLRSELAPFDVKVVTLFTGDVGTKFWDAGHLMGSHEGLPESSPYLLMKDRAESMMRGQTIPKGQHTRERWAAAVVGDLLKANPPCAIRRGSLATVMWLVSLFVPTFLLDLMFWRTSRLGQFKANLRRQETLKKRQ